MTRASYHSTLFPAQYPARFLATRQVKEWSFPLVLVFIENQRFENRVFGSSWAVSLCILLEGLDRNTFVKATPFDAMDCRQTDVHWNLASRVVDQKIRAEREWSANVDLLRCQHVQSALCMSMPRARAGVEQSGPHYSGLKCGNKSS